MSRFLPHLTATPLQTTTYLLGIALFSIAFLVFLNSSISFIITDILNHPSDLGNIVGTLSFADELLAIVACPLWGLLSDRIGVRWVAVAGYVVVGASLVGLVQSRRVWPDVLLGRLAFSVGAAACSTMVTAGLSGMVAERRDVSHEGAKEVGGGETADTRAEDGRDEERTARNGSGGLGHCATPSVSSELTITPTRFTSRSRSRRASTSSTGDSKGRPADNGKETSQLAGFVGLFTGLGALLALAVFLPLPVRFRDAGQSPADSVRTSFYVVAAVAVVVAVFIALGLRGLPGEESKGLSTLFRRPSTPTDDKSSASSRTPPFKTLLTRATALAFSDPDIGLACLGGFVARASSVGISLFIPLFVNAYYIRSGRCPSNPGTGANLPDVKEHCKDAYRLAAALTGVSQTAALVCAPLFGYLGGRRGRRGARGKDGKATAGLGLEWPLLGSAVVGALGNVGFGLLRNPDAFQGKGGQWSFLAVIAMGVGQIGAIVCSLGLLGRGLNAPRARGGAEGEGRRPGTAETVTQGAETAPLLPKSGVEDAAMDRGQLKGSIAGIYSLVGGAGILLLTKLGGWLFDRWTEGAPFFLLAVFSAVLAVAVVVVGGASRLAEMRRRSEEEEGAA